MSTATTVELLPVSAIRPGANDRHKFDGLEDLAASIRAAGQGIEGHGLHQPIKVRPVADGRYEIIMGERRFRTCTQLLGWSVIPALIVDYDDAAARAAMATENLARADLTPIEEAQCYRRLQELDQLSIKEIAAVAGVKAHRVTDRLALLDLCPEAQDMVAKGHLGLKYAAILAQRTSADAVALDFNFQMQALRLLQANKAPTLEWWSAEVTALIGACRQDSLFDMGAFMAARETEVQQQTATLPPLPDVDGAPPVDSDDPAVIMAAQIRYWQDAADRWGALGRKTERRTCLATVRQLTAAQAVLAPMFAALQDRVLAALAPGALPAWATDPLPDPAPMALPAWAQLPAPAPAPAPDLLVAPLVGRVGRRRCACGARATHQVSRTEHPDSQHKRLIMADVCNTCLIALGGTPQAGAGAEQLAFVAA